MRIWIPQYPKSYNCGQIAVAVVAGTTPENVAKIIGKKGSTKTKDLVKALRKLGVRCAGKMKKLKERPPLAIAQVHKKGKSGWHWVVLDNFKIWDGSYGTPSGRVFWPEGWRVTSYLEIYE